MIFGACQLQEICREQHGDLYTVFIDLSKAFGTVGGSGLRQLLRKFGCPEKFTNIVRQFHDGMQCHVSFDGMLSDRFMITSEVKQGSVVAPVLFCLFYTAMFDEATRSLDAGVRIRIRTTGKLFNLGRLRSSKKVFSELVCELLYVDDCDIEAHTVEDLQLITDCFVDAAQK